MAKIKICGIRRKEDIDYVNKLKPDYIGFILTSGFRRSIDFDTAKRLKSMLSDDIRAVGVFVNDSLENINRFLDEKIIDAVQLHGNEEPEFCSKINSTVIKYFKPDDFDKINSYSTDFYLFDSGTGTGKAFDWSKIPKTDKPFFLAGGINKDNIGLAIKSVNPYCIDLSSAVETDGVKDYNKIKEIMECTENE
ncbi:MAG: phosphoribosylanthranilate isomerase [Acutalibacteraceae bacterium]